MRLRKRISALSFIIFLFWATGTTVFAHEVPNSTQRGSISVTMTCGGSAVPGGTLTLYRVGAAAEENGNYSFVLTGAFAKSNLVLDDISSADTAKSLAEYAERQSISGTETEIGIDGTTVFSDLEQGLYLLVQKKAAEGYEAAAPFMVSIPMNENGVYLYDVDATPKTETEMRNETVTPPPVTPDPTLPQTGQLNWPIPAMAVLGLLLFSIGWILRFRQKEEQL